MDDIALLPSARGEFQTHHHIIQQYPLDFSEQPLLVPTCHRVPPTLPHHPVTRGRAAEEEKISPGFYLHGGLIKQTKYDKHTHQHFPCSPRHATVFPQHTHTTL
jgi:hypothetical protein